MVRSFFIATTSVALLGLAVPGSSGPSPDRRAPEGRSRGIERAALGAHHSSLHQVKPVKNQKKTRAVSRRGTGNYRNGGTARSTTVRRPMASAVGTITYDDGVGTSSFGGGAIIGNRFDTHNGVPVLASGTVSAVQAVVVPGPVQTTSTVAVIVLGPQTGGGGASALFNTTVTASGPTFTVNVGGIGANYTGSSFFAVISDFASGYIPLFGTGTNAGQGHHGMVGYTGGAFPNFVSTFNFGGALNGLVRATGNIVPVELMTFEVE